MPQSDKAQLIEGTSRLALHETQPSFKRSRGLLNPHYSPSIRPMKSFDSLTPEYNIGEVVRFVEPGQSVSTAIDPYIGEITGVLVESKVISYKMRPYSDPRIHSRIDQKSKLIRRERGIPDSASVSSLVTFGSASPSVQEVATTHKQAKSLDWNAMFVPQESIIGRFSTHKRRFEEADTKWLRPPTTMEAYYAANSNRSPSPDLAPLADSLPDVFYEEDGSKRQRVIPLTPEGSPIPILLIPEEEGMVRSFFSKIRSRRSSNSSHGSGMSL